MNATEKKLLSVFLSSSLLLASISSPSLADSGEALPKFTDIARVVQAQPVVGGHVLAWNYMAANAMGLPTAAGRVGDAAFEKSVFDLVGVTIKKDTPVSSGSNKKMTETINRWSADAAKQGQKVRVLEVEMDAHGGAGRAGYLKVPTADGGETWVNIKGIGVTGAGNADGKKPGPPSAKWASHSDGGAMLAEGLREYINGVMSHNELKFGGSRVIGVLEINQEMKLTGGDMDSLVIIVREPWRRMDRAQDANETKDFDRIPWALGQANAKRIMKGDFVNSSNMGFDGGFIDYGLISFVNGFVPATNYLEVEMHAEMEYLFGDDAHAKEVYRYAKGFYLMNQLGFEEPRIQKMTSSVADGKQRLIQLADSFQRLIRAENIQTRIDWDKWNKKEVEGNFRAQQLFRSVLFDILTAQNTNGLVDTLVAKSAQYVDRPSASFNTNIRDFLTKLVASSELVIQSQPIADIGEYAKSIRRVAEFKNRDLWDLSKQPMWENLTKVGNDFRQNHNQSAVQTALDDLLIHNQLSTGHFDSSEMNVTADSRSAYIHIPAVRQADGRSGLRLYPELPSVGAGENYSFAISFDGGKSSAQLDGTLVDTSAGLYYRIKIPHGQYPVTTEPLLIRPSAHGSVAKSVVIKGPPLFLNERMGLQPDLVQTQSKMLTEYGVHVGPNEQSFKRRSTGSQINSCQAVFGQAG